MALGKGLDSLIQSDEETSSASDLDENEQDELQKEQRIQPESENLAQKGQIVKISISKIRPNPHQPREEFPEKKLSELVESIKEYGVVQPITVTPLEEGEFELVAGERRLKASDRAGKNEVPAIIKDTTEREQMELALIENIQRHDLNPLEEALAYNNLMNKFGLTQSEVAERVGKSRSAVANMLRLLELPDEIKQGLRNREITTGKARALLSLDSAEKQIDLFNKVLKKGLSVRELEQHAYQQKESNNTSDSSANKTKAKKDPNILAREEGLETKLGTKVNIKKSNSGEGKIEIDFYSVEELKRILDKIN